MSDFEVVEAVVRKTAQRQHFQRVWSGFWHGLFWGMVAGLLLLVLYKFLPVPISFLIWSALALPLGALIGCLHGWMKRQSLQQAARFLDGQQKLEERLSTAMEFSSATSPDQANRWKQLILADAAQHARKLDARRLLPLYLPRVSRWVLLGALVGAGLGFVPEYRSKKYLQAKNDEKLIEETGKQLLELTRHSLAQRQPILEPTQKTMQSVEELGMQMSKASLTRDESLKELASLSEKLKDQIKDLGKAGLPKSLEKAARENGGGTPAPGSPELQKQIESAQKELGSKAPDQAGLESMQEKLEKAQQAAANLPKGDTAESQQARAQLQASLAELANQAREMGQSIPSLEEAIEALKSGKVDQMIQDLAESTTDLEKLQDMARTLQQLQQQAGKLGKDLAEQLKNGQVEAAQNTLEKMSQQLKASGLTPDEMKKLMEEVAKAIDPAGEYGKVADLLKQAGTQMKKDENSGASQSLKEAADELAKLSEQLKDAQSLAATLEAMRKAEMAVSSRKSMSSFKNSSLCKSCNGGGCRSCGGRGWNHGGKGGPAGVGTWAEEAGWIQYPQKSGFVDNSGVERPDMEGRGVSDRGEGELPENLEPSKIKGQMAPGGPMPSITLKGVSIKGQSTVGFQEAASAAQVDAANALNQDQVPRAYQGAVREYFDDLKK